MMCTYLDVQPDSKVGHYLSNKRISIITGYVQLAVYGVTLLNYIFDRASVMKILQNSNVKYAVAILLALLLVGYSVFLLYGVYKDRASFMKIYLNINIVLTVLYIATFLYAMCARVKDFGAGAFVQSILTIMLNILFYFIIRNYYLSVLRNQNKDADQIPPQLESP